MNHLSELAIIVLAFSTMYGFIFTWSDNDKLKSAIEKLQKEIDDKHL